METRTAHIAHGWEVVGSDGHSIGHVKGTGEDYVLVTAGRLFKHDLYVPIDHITEARDGRVAVNVPANHVDEEGWRYPPSMAFSHENPAYPEVPATTMIQTAGYSAGHLSAPEPQGAVLDDGVIEEGEVPGDDVNVAGDTPSTRENPDQTS